MRSHAKASFVKLTLDRCAPALALLFLTLVVCALGAARASADTRVLLERFGPDGTSNTAFSNPQSITFNQSTKMIYAVDAGANKIYAFGVSPSGAITPLGGNFPLTVPTSGNGRGLAVDNTALSSAGNIYFVAGSNADQNLYGYNSTGAPLGGNFPVAVPGLVSSVAVDSTGHVWVVDRTAKVIRRYSSTGVQEGTPIDVSALAGTISTSAKLAFDSNDDLYYAAAGGPAYRITAASGYTVSTEVANSTPSIRYLAVAPTTHNLYIPRELSGNSRIEARNSAGDLLYEFGNAIPGGTNQVYQGVTVNASRDEIYSAESIRFKQILIFSQVGVPPPVTLNSASGLTGTHASLSGTVNPEGVAITECKFEYGLTTAYGQSVPCVGSIPTDASPHTVTAALANLLPQGTTYHYRIFAKNAFAPGISADRTFTTPNTFATTAASNLTNTSAALNGTVNPDGVAITECKFEYGPTTSYGSSVPCSPEAGAIPNDAAPHAVSAALSGLQPNVIYHYRLVVVDGLGSFKAEDQVVQALGPPQISAEAAASGDEEAILSSYVNPRGANTSYYYEFGKDATYGNRAPADFSFFIGAGTVPVQGSFHASGLEPNTTYHYRISASNEYGATNGPDQTFTTALPNSSCPNSQLRTEQTSASYPQGTVGLPECMALEMVSPPKKYNQNAGGPDFSLNGDAVRYVSLAALADTPQLGSISDSYVATRGSSGWISHRVKPPLDFSIGTGSIGSPCSFRPDLSRWTAVGTTGGQVNSDAVFAFSGNIDGLFSRLSPMLFPVNLGVSPFALGFTTCQGGSVDGSMAIFSVPGVTYLPNDPPVPSNTTTLQFDSSNAYIAHLDQAGNPTVELLARDSGGTNYGGACGASVGAKGASAYRGAISPDGARVYFTTRPAQPEGVLCDFTNKQRIMKRLQTPSGPQISQVESSECTRVSPPCSNANGSDTYVGASQEGGIVYFTTTRQLANTDLDAGSECGSEAGKSAGCDLYLHDESLPAGHQLIQVSAGDNTDPTQGSGAEVLGVCDMSGDGSHVYFVATGLLTTAPNVTGKIAEAGKPNLYVYERDAKYPSGHTAFIGTLSSADGKESEHTWGKGGPGVNSAQAVPLLGSNPEDLSTGGDGHILVFTSKASLIADDTDGGHSDVYRYDSSSGSLQRISRSAPGGSDNGPFDVESQELRIGAEPLPQAASFQRWVSEDGRTVLFATKEAFSPTDTDGRLNAYFWHDGQIAQLAGSTSGQNTGLSTRHPTLSTSGDEVAFASPEELLPQDGDTTRDVYVARVDGGFTIPVAPSTCSGEACQGESQSPPVSPALPSQGANGQGNVKSAPATKPKKHKHKHKHHKKTRHDRHAKNNRRAAK